jgi:hypothetical protein
VQFGITLHTANISPIQATKSTPTHLQPSNMFHVIRNADGAIQAVARQALPASEPVDERDPELMLFLSGGVSPPGFDAADAEFVRVLEDLIDTLISKNVIRHTDLPPAAQQKLVKRKGLRNRMQGALNLLGGDGQVI